MSASASISRIDANQKHSGLEFQVGRDEINLAEFPLWYHGKYPPKTKTLVYTSTINDSGAGRIIERKMTVRGVEEYGLPSARDGDVLIALFKLAWQDNQFESRTFSFTFKELLDELEWDDSGKNYDRIEMAIKRWDSVHITYDGWYDKGIQGWADGPMLCGILGGGKLQTKRKRHLKSTMRWHEDFYETLRNKNILEVDHSAYKKLKTPSAKQALRFLSKEFGIKPIVNIELRQLACEHFGLSRTYKPNKLRSLCDEIFEQLEAVNKIQPAGPEGRYVRESRSVWMVTIKKPRHTPLPADARQGKLFADNPLDNSLVGKLVKRGVDQQGAEELTAKHSATIIERQIEIYDWKLRNGAKRIEKPGPYLRTHIQKDYDPPAGFQTQSDLLVQTAAAEKSKAQRNQKAAADKKAAQKAADKAEEKRRREWYAMEEHLLALAPAEREACIESAINTLPATMRKKARQYLIDGKDDCYYEVALRNHVLPIIQTEAAA